MANYTMTIREICQALTNDFSPMSDPETLITSAAPLIFSFEYPIWDSTKKVPFQKMILRNFFLEEIGRETYQEWKMRLQNWMIINMPYYNRLYSAVDKEFDIFSDVNLTRTYTEQSSENSTASSTGTTSGAGTNTGKYSETPQGTISNLQQDKYLTNAQISETENSTNATSQSTGEGTRSATREEVTKGKQGMQSYSSLLKEYLDAVQNIDRKLLEAMEVLFMGVM